MPEFVQRTVTLGVQRNTPPVDSLVHRWSKQMDENTQCKGVSRLTDWTSNERDSQGPLAGDKE